MDTTIIVDKGHAILETKSQAAFHKEFVIL